MSDYTKDSKRNGENTSSENLELFKRALSEVMNEKVREIEKEIENIEVPPPSNRHKMRMNSMFCELTDGTFIPYTEVDNL